MVNDCFAFENLLSYVIGLHKYIAERYNPFDKSSIVPFKQHRKKMKSLMTELKKIQRRKGNNTIGTSPTHS